MHPNTKRTMMAVIAFFGGSASASLGVCSGWNGSDEADPPAGTAPPEAPFVVPALDRDLNDTDCNRPFDLEVAVGFDRVICVSNCWVGLFDKDGVELDRVKLKHGNPIPTPPGFFEPLDPDYRLADPDGYFDWHADSGKGRFWVVATEGEDSAFTVARLHVAVSVADSMDSLDGTNWHKFVFDMLDGEPPPVDIGVHRPILSVDEQYVYLSLLDFEKPWAPHPNTPPPSVQRTTLMVMEKGSMMNGNYPTEVFWLPLDDPQQFPLDGNTWGHSVAVPYGETTPFPLVYVIAPVEAPGADPPSLQEHVIIGAFYKPGTTWVYESHLVPIETLTPGFFGSQSSITGPNQTTVGTMLTHPWHAVYSKATRRTGSLWAAFNGEPPVGSPPEPAGHEIVWWFEFDLNGWPIDTRTPPTLAQAGVIDLGGQTPPWEVHDPSLSVSSRGAMAITWTQTGSGSGQWPQMWRGIRLASDMPGTLPDVQMVMDSSNVQLSGHASDFTGTHADPADPCAFYAHSGLAKSDGSAWQSWLARYEPAECRESRPCYPDCDNNGQLDFFDFLCFQNTFLAGEPYADCDGNGVLDFFDFLCFQYESLAGCS